MGAHDDPNDRRCLGVSAAPLQAVLVDEYELARVGLGRVLADHAGAAVVASVGDGAAALAALHRGPADLLIADHGALGPNGAALIQPALALRPRLRIVVIGAHESAHHATQALEAGAHGYLLRTSTLAELLLAVDVVLQGRLHVSPNVNQRVLEGLGSGGSRVGLSALSPKELAVLRSLSSGTSLKGCAAELGVSVSTASTYRSRLMEKLGLRSAADMFRFAMENGVVR